MLGLNTKLAELESQNNKIKVALVGAGQMGKGMVSQMILMKGMTPSLVIDIDIQNAIEAFTLAGIPQSDIVVAKDIATVNKALEEEKYIASDNSELATAANLIDVVVDATGVPEVGAKIALDSIFNKKTYSYVKCRDRCSSRANLEQISTKCWCGLYRNCRR